MTGPAADAAYYSAKAVIDAAVQKLTNLGLELLEAVNRALATLPEIAAGIRDAVARFTELFKKGMAELARFVEEATGDPGAIRDIGDQWTEIGGTATTYAARLQGAQLPSAGYWKGTAANEYFFRVVPNQTGALTVVKDVTDGIRTALNDIANALGSYWSGVATEVGVLLGAMVGAVSLAWSPPGVPLAVAAGIAAFIYFLTRLNFVNVEFTNTMENVGSAFAQNEALKTHFDDGSWPPIKSADNILYDASVKDGNPSEWQPTREPR